MDTYTQLKFPVPVFDIDFHPTDSKLAVALVTGHVLLYNVDLAENTRIFRRRFFKDSVRCSRFSNNGNDLYVAGNYRKWISVSLETEAITRIVDLGNKEPINALAEIDENTLATGDDSGCVQVWDLRSNSQIYQLKENVDYISDIKLNADGNQMLCTSGDGCLAVFDLRKQKAKAVSVNQDSDLLCLQVLADKRRVVVGTQGGEVGVFKYGDFGTAADRFDGHPDSVDCLAKAYDDVCFSGCGDGLVRALGFCPHATLGIVGDMRSNVDHLCICEPRNVLAASSQENEVQFWDVSRYKDIAGAPDNNGERGGGDSSGSGDDSGDDTGDDSGSGSEWDTDSAGDDDGRSAAKRKQPQPARPVKQRKKMTQSDLKKEKKKQFFADLG